MRSLYHRLIWQIKGVQLYALVGRSGTGKSFRAKLLAQKYGIDLIIDDGLLILDQKIIAGHSAKKETNILSAIKTAIFENDQHKEEALLTLRKNSFKRILLVGTSVKMVNRIINRLELPELTKTIFIEEIATQEEIEAAQKSRTNEGKHIIPVPALEISGKYSHIFYDTIKVFLKKGILSLKNEKVFEKTVVRPEFQNKGSVAISKSALLQMIQHCIEEFDDKVKIKKISIKHAINGYRIKVSVRVPFGSPLASRLQELQKYIVDSLERYTGIMIEKLDMIVDDIGGVKSDTDQRITGH